MRVALAWAGGIMYELITADGPGSDLFNALLPASGEFCLRQHHIGYLIQNDADWEALHAGVARRGWSFAGGHDMPGFLKFRFVEVPLLPHYCEYIYPETTGIAYLESIPVN